MNFFISIIGWALFNLGEMELRKRELDDDGNPQTNFTFSEYAKKKRLSWIGSLLMIPVILWIGAKQIDLKPLSMLTDTEHSWSDLYYLGAGFAWELLIFAVTKIHKFIKKMSA